MGLCIDSDDDKALGRYAVEVRRRSFRLIGDGFEVEIDTADIPHIRHALDLVEHHSDRGE